MFMGKRITVSIDDVEIKDTLFAVTYSLPYSMFLFCFLELIFNLNHKNNILISIIEKIGIFLDLSEPVCKGWKEINSTHSHRVCICQICQTLRRKLRHQRVR